MAAAATDYFTKVGDPGTATTLSAPGHTIGGTSITVVSTTNWPTTTGVIFAMDTVTVTNGVETRDTGTYTEWEGVVASATSITGLVLRTGTDQNYPAGATTRVYIPVAAAKENRMVDGLLVSHDQDGTLKAGAVDNAAALAVDVVTDAKLLYGKVRSRQGGSATNWSTSGTTTYDYSGTDTFIQCGTIAITGNPQTITYPTAYNQVPIIIGSVVTGASNNCWVRFASQGTTTFTASVYSETGAKTTETISWIAIGQ